MPKYRVLHRVVRSDGFSLGEAIHICGNPMFVCVSCGYVFCSSCDPFFHRSQIRPCCNEAVDEYVSTRDANDEQRQWREDQATLARRAGGVRVEEVGQEI